MFADHQEQQQPICNIDRNRRGCRPCQSPSPNPDDQERQRQVELPLEGEGPESPIESVKGLWKKDVGHSCVRKKLFDSGPPAVARKAQVCARDENDGQGDRQRDVVRRQQSSASPYEKCLRLEPFVPVACERKVQAKKHYLKKE